MVGKRVVDIIVGVTLRLVSEEQNLFIRIPSGTQIKLKYPALIKMRIRANQMTLINH